MLACLRRSPTALLLLGLLSDGCGRGALIPPESSASAPPTPAIARALDAPSDRLHGPAATGASGDLVLENGLVAAVISRRPPEQGFGMSAGNLVDLAPLPGRTDLLNEVILYLADDFPRQALYETVEIGSPGGGGDPATVVARGLDSKDRRVTIETEYRLEPGARWLTLTSRFTLTATRAIARYAVGDAIQWGRAQSLSPGHGFDIAGKRLPLDWVAALGEGTSYAYLTTGGKIDTRSGAMWSDPIGAVVELPPGEAREYVRHLVVGTGDTSSLSESVARLKARPFGRIAGQVREHDGRVITGARVRIDDEESHIHAFAASDADGRFTCALPPGRYRAFATAPGRREAPPIHIRGPASAAAALHHDTLQLRPGEVVELSFEMSRESVLAWRVEDTEPRAFLPVKVTVRGERDTPDPVFGPMFRADGAGPFVLSPRGIGEVPLAPGDYRVFFSRGPEYALFEESIQVTPGARVELSAHLARVLDTRGFISTDLHQHAVPSFDSGVSLEDRAISNAVEGVEVLVATDHNVLTDYAPIVTRLGLDPVLTSIVGTEATTHSVGHFNALPLAIARDHPRGGMEDPEGRTPAEIFALLRRLAWPALSPLIQVNHPRSGKTGYFHLMQLDPVTGRAKDPRFVTDFDAVEVISIDEPEETKAAIEDWYGMLRKGHRITGTGNSDGHTISFREIGWPRTFVCLEHDSPVGLDVAAFTKALRDGCATISVGPLVTIESGSVRMGGLLSAKRGRFEVEVHVAAAPWVPTDRLTLLVDGVPTQSIPLSGHEVVRHHARHPLACQRDCFVTAFVTSSAPLPPIFGARVGRAPPLPLGLTNPIYVDVDGDGRFAPGS